MTVWRKSLVLTSGAMVCCFMGLLFCSVWGQEKGGGQIAPPTGEKTTPDTFTSAAPTDRVVSTDSTPMIFQDRQPFPPKGFAKGVIVTLGDDSGEVGTYRIAFKWQMNGQEFPLIECRQLQALEDKLITSGRDARHGKLTVEVKGTVTLYRDMNFLLLSEFRLAEGPFKRGGIPAGAGGLKDLQ